MSDEEFERAGGNRSATHVDFMIGSASSTSTASSRTADEPLMRRGEWVRSLTASRIDLVRKCVRGRNSFA